jgi:hypothetical protein
MYFLLQPLELLLDNYLKMSKQHTQFRKLVHGYLFILPQPSEILEILKHAHVLLLMKCL